MPRLVDLSNLKRTKSIREDISYEDSSNDNTGTGKENDANLMVSILLKRNPDKLIYSLKDASELLGIGQEFLRRRIKSGRIKSVRLGDKPAINLIELARILSEGV